MGSRCIDRELSEGLCDDLEGSDEGVVGGRLEKEGVYVYIQAIHFLVQQKLKQRYKEIVYQ